MIQKLFSTAYFPPVDYMQEMKNADAVFIEMHEHYQKQTYRNRTTILTGNGLYDLIIPIEKPSSNLIKEIRIDHSVPWQRNHWRTIESAYSKGPYFLFLRDFFEPFFNKKYVFLFDFDMEILLMLRQLFSITNSISFTSDFEKKVEKTADFRDQFLPKNRIFRPKQMDYLQIFSDRYPFEPNISCIDYLFTTGCVFL
ncbi:MAG: WbqC family protein [Bacteroidales bacterium]|jgi:hypothetical protein|nr:WbqC family protein [Bacteroidales bacterium]